MKPRVRGSPGSRRQQLRVFLLKLKATAVIGTLSLLSAAAFVRVMVFPEMSAELTLYAVLTVCLPAYYFTFVGFREAKPFTWKYKVFAWSFVFTYVSLAVTLMIFSAVVPTE